MVGPFPEAGHAAITLTVPGPKASDYAERALARLTPGDLGAFGTVQIFVWRRSRFTRPLFRVPDADVCVGFAAIRGSADPATLERMVAGNRVLYEDARAIGGTLYPFSALELSHDDWRKHYGSAWPVLARAKRVYDPGNVLASGPDLFGRHPEAAPPG